MYSIMLKIVSIYRYACDIRVVRFLRERTLGNSSTRLMKQLMEQHTEEWLNKTLRYLTECSHFVDQPGLIQMPCQEPPVPAVVPTFRWLLTVYGKDILTRLEEVKASITCTFRSILKMDSTRKVCS